MKKGAQPIDKFAAQNRLKVVLDECGDPCIQGSRAKLYFDEEALCMIAVDARVSGVSLEVLNDLDADRTWVGDVYRDSKQRGYRDVWLKGIPKAKWGAAIKLARCRTRRKVSEEQREALAHRLKVARASKKTPVRSVESPAKRGRGK